MRFSPPRAAVCATLSLGLLGMGPFERNDPSVARGIEAYEAGRFDEALAAFEAAQRAHPEAAELDLNRGDALHRLKRLEEAKASYERAAARGDQALKQKSLFNLGNTLAALGRKSDAISAYRRALLLDPTDKEARRNLELLLKDPSPPPPSPDAGSDAGEDAGSPPPTPDAGPDGGTPNPPDGGADGGAGQPPDAGSDGGDGQGTPDGGRDGGDDAGVPENEGGEKQRPDAGAPNEKESSSEPQGSDKTVDAGQAKEERLSEDEAKRLLDSMKESEKSLQLWRFQKRKPRTANEKDW